jgi:hypothetical protein
MKSPNFVALAASFAIAAATLGVFYSTSITATPVTSINGSHVTDLAPVVVYANADTNVASL